MCRLYPDRCVRDGAVEQDHRRDRLTCCAAGTHIKPYGAIVDVDALISPSPVLTVLVELTRSERVGMKTHPNLRNSNDTI